MKIVKRLGGHGMEMRGGRDGKRREEANGERVQMTTDEGVSYAV
jgi:hypothetical protein